MNHGSVKKWHRYSVGLLVICITLLIVFCVARFYVFLRAPIIVQNDFHYVLNPGENAQTFVSALHQQAQLRSPFLFKLLIYINLDAHRLKAGEYLFPKNARPLDVLRQVVAGDVVYHSLTIVNGWHFQKLMQVLNHNALIQHTLKKDSPKKIALLLGIHRASPEGLFFPDTYKYTLGTTDLTLLKWAHDKMDRYLESAWQNRAADLSYKSVYQAVIVASLIEKETAIESERPMIAAVILKRLKKWMPLQIDATVIYGLKDKFDGQLTRKDLRLKTPYNTYLNYGLPPTPIAIPGAPAIEAALHPAHTKALYFVAKGDGRHVFSKTLREHEEAVLKYQIDPFVKKHVKKGRVK